MPSEVERWQDVEMQRAEDLRGDRRTVEPALQRAPVENEIELVAALPGEVQ